MTTATAAPAPEPQRASSTTSSGAVPAWVHFAEVPPETDQEPEDLLVNDEWEDRHVTPVGAWLIVAFGLLLVVAAWWVRR